MAHACYSNLEVIFHYHAGRLLVAKQTRAASSNSHRLGFRSSQPVMINPFPKFADHFHAPERATLEYQLYPTGMRETL